MTAAETVVAGRYRIGPCLGTGGMGRVWQARDQVLRRDVAIKEIALPFGLTDEEREEMRARTLREARAAARLSHPNVVRIYDVQQGDERPWIVMEFVPSRSLLQVIRENGPLPPKDVAGIGLAVLAALDAADRAGVVHRDVKPSNVLIADDGRVLLTDFGAALIDEGEGALTQTGVILGSPRYIAPERATTGVSTLESDLWSLGATLYEAVEGRGPYTRDTTMAMLVALATERPDPVDLAGPLRPVLNGLLQKDPKRRMRLPEVEKRLRKIADVQNAVRLHQVPRPRLGRTIASPPAPAAPAGPDSSDGVVVRLEAVPVPPASGPDGGPGPAARKSMGPDHLTQLAPAPVTRSPTPVRPLPVVTRRRRLRRLLAAASVAAAVLIASAVYLVAEGRSGEPPAGAAASVAVTVPPSAPAAAAALPAGFRWYTSPSGFRLASPDGWRRTGESRTGVTLRHAGEATLVSVREWQPSDPDLSAALRREETAATLRDYRRVRLDATPQRDTAEWEYTFTDPAAGPLHALDRAVTRGGRSYLIRWRTPAAEWVANLATRDAVLDSFHPAG